MFEASPVEAGSCGLLWIRRVACAASLVAALTGASLEAEDLSESELPPGRPVRSSGETASTGRTPLAVRIAMAEKTRVLKPLQTPATVGRDTAMSVEEVSPKAPKAPEPPARSAAEEPSFRGRPQGGSSGMQSDFARSRVPADPDRRTLLGRVKERLAVVGPQNQQAAARTGLPRLVVECEESQAEAVGGDTVTWRIAIRNFGGPARGVTTTVFFGDGIEPLRASGMPAVVSPGQVQFGQVDCLPTGGVIEMTVSGEARDPGTVAWRVETSCREVGGRVARESVLVIRPR